MLENSKRFTKGMREAQTRYGTARQAEALVDNPSYSHDFGRLWPGFKAFIESRSFFFIASADASGRCQCNYRGGEPGFVVVEGDTCLYFPDYSGNGLLHTVGNFMENPHAGLLFIDFTANRRVKVNGRVSVIDDPEALRRFRGYPGYREAIRVIRLDVEYAVVNCSRYLDRVSLDGTDGEER